MHLGHLYTSFEGRINRAASWLGAIILFVVTLVALLVATFVIGISFDGSDSRLKLVTFALQLALLYPSAALMVKRLHDRNRPGYFAAFMLVPAVVKQVTDLLGRTGDPFNMNALDWVLNAIIFVVAVWFFVGLGCLRGTVGPNRYGPDPLDVASTR
jgi:uncharacterized membrane protein YhaH (DUF805 family)